MLYKLLVVLLFSTFALTPVFANTHSPSMSPSTMNSIQKDDEILGFLIVLNKNEINAANEALQKTSNSAVKDYANMMIEQHTKNLDDTMKIAQQMNAKPIETAFVKHLKNKGHKEVKKLSTLSNQQFNIAYINAMVKDHTEALKLINNLLTRVTNPTIKTHLEMTKEHVAMHLKDAEIIQRNLKA